MLNLRCILHLQQFVLARSQVLSSHMWQVATTLILRMCSTCPTAQGTELPRKGDSISLPSLHAGD